MNQLILPDGVVVKAPEGAVLVQGAIPDNRAIYTIEDQVVTTNGQPARFFAGNNYCNKGDVVQLQGNITDSEGNTVTSINLPVSLKMPLVRHANGQPTDAEIYLDATIQSGVITATGEIESSGDWKMLIERSNEALKRISKELQAIGIDPFKFSAADITFIA